MVRKILSTRLVSCGPRKRKQGRKEPAAQNKRRRKMSVRFAPFHDTIPFDDDDESNTTWLSPKEFASCRQEVELTIFLREQGSLDAKAIMVAQNFCSRGLEDYCSPHIASTSNMVNCLKTEVLLRRKLVISAVLEEQEIQRRKRMQEGTAEHDGSTGDRDGKTQPSPETNEPKQQPPPSPPFYYDDIAMRNACLSRNNRDNVLRAVERALRDADDGRLIYKEWARCSAKTRRRWKGTRSSTASAS